MQAESRAVPVRGGDQEAHLVVDADAETSSHAEGLRQPSHADQHEVKIVDGRALYDPVEAGRQELDNRHLGQQAAVVDRKHGASCLVSRDIPHSQTLQYGNQALWYERQILQYNGQVQ